MPSHNHGLSSRASSATLSVRQQQLNPINGLDGHGIDRSIAQSLLDGPRIPERHNSLKTVHATETSNSSESNNDESRRGAIRTSNTWTSSSRDGLTDVDEIEDRTYFVDEYNRLAEKVWRNSCIMPASKLTFPLAWHSNACPR